MDNYIDFLLELSIDFSNVGSTYNMEQDLDVIKAENQCHDSSKYRKNGQHPLHLNSLFDETI